MPQHNAAHIKAALKYLVVLAALFVFIGWILNTPSGLLGKADAIGYAVCHRIDARSFHIDSRQLPLCARCSGMYLGAVVGLAYQVIFARKRCGTPHWRVIIPLVLFVLAFGVDGSNSYLYLIKETYSGALARIPNLYVPNNTLRMLTGTVWPDSPPGPARADRESGRSLPYGVHQRRRRADPADDGLQYDLGHDHAAGERFYSLFSVVAGACSRVHYRHVADCSD